jgi:hypothetical protein
MIDDIVKGIDGTSIRAGVIGEIGHSPTFNGAACDWETVALTAAARAQKATGAALSLHLGPPSHPAVFPYVKAILAQEGVGPERVIIGHANSSNDFASYGWSTGTCNWYMEQARAGYYIAFDTAMFENGSCITTLIGEGLIDKILVSHDICRTDQLHSGNGQGYDFLCDTVASNLVISGISNSSYAEHIMVTNPARVFVIKRPPSERMRQVLGRQPDGTLRMYQGDGHGSWAPGTGQILGTGWQMFDLMVGTDDFTGDGFADVVARKPDGTLWLYRGNGAGGWLTGIGEQVGAAWNMFDQVVAPGDFSGDGLADIIGRKPDGTLWLYRGNGAGGWLTGVGEVIGAAWNVFDAIVATGDFTGDGKADLMARKPDGTMLLYPGDGAGSWQQGYGSLIGQGWNMYNAVFSR